MIWSSYKRIKSFCFFWSQIRQQSHLSQANAGRLRKYAKMYRRKSMFPNTCTSAIVF